MMDISESLDKIENFQMNNTLKNIISTFENDLKSKTLTEIEGSLQNLNFDSRIYDAAVQIKKVTSQIDVTIHAWGILCALPSILEPNEKIEYLSLGAGNTGKQFDLSTNKRVAEFKFINWQGGPESIRQNGIFKDFYNLVENGDDNRKRCLYVLNTEIPLKFLNGRRSMKSILSRNQKLKNDFESKYGDIEHICQYYNKFKHMVEIIDIKEHIPEII